MSADFRSGIFRAERLHLAIATVAGLGMAVVIALYAVGYGGNPVKAIMQLVGMTLMLVATVNPKAGLALLFLSGAYLDFLKRFLILFGSGSMGDVAGVLSVAPVTILGVFLGTCVLHPIFTKRMLDQRERRLVFFSLFLIGVSLASGLRLGNLDLSGIGAVANKSAYSLLVPIIYVLYRREGTAGIGRLLRFLTLVYVPVALYGIYQYVFGLSQFEINYLRSGLTTTGENLYDVHPRAFSTLNSNHAFAVSMGILSLLSVVLCSRSLRGRTGFFSTRGRWLLPLLFIVACLLSFGRGGWIVTALGMICMAAFRTRPRVVVFYLVFAVSFGLLVWQADLIYASLDKIQSYLPTNTAFQEQAFRIGTYSERLYGFQNVFSNRAMWTWFGNPSLAYKAGEQLGEENIVHDALGQLLITYGIVGLLLLATAGGLALLTLHRKILAIPEGPDEILGRGLLSIGTATFFGGMLTGSHLAVFPINVLFWTAAGTLVTRVLTSGRVPAAMRPADPAEQEPRRPEARERLARGKGRQMA